MTEYKIGDYFVINTEWTDRHICPTIEAAREYAVNTRNDRKLGPKLKLIVRVVEVIGHDKGDGPQLIDPQILRDAGFVCLDA